jgi:hypothetical protein
LVLHATGTLHVEEVSCAVDVGTTSDMRVAHRLFSPGSLRAAIGLFDHVPGERAIRCGPGIRDFLRPGFAQAPFQRPQQRGADDRVMLRLYAVGDMTLGQEFERPLTTTPSVAMSFWRCSAISAGNIAFACGATSNSRS